MSRYLRPIRRGEYDLVNMMNAGGVDPCTGLSFDACYDQWDRCRKVVVAEYEAIPRWAIWRRFAAARKLYAVWSWRGC